MTRKKIRLGKEDSLYRGPGQREHCTSRGRAAERWETRGPREGQGCPEQQAVVLLVFILTPAGGQLGAKSWVMQYLHVKDHFSCKKVQRNWKGMASAGVQVRADAVWDSAVGTEWRGTWETLRWLKYLGENIWWWTEHVRSERCAMGNSQVSEVWNGKNWRGLVCFVGRNVMFLRSVLKYLRKIPEKWHGAPFKVRLANYLLLVRDKVSTEN